ncbi:hypothetical protein TeGR_g5087, partial [Tetraparma gracilis]
MPGRIIGVTVDDKGQPCLRMAMQTREQHIRRDKATSNICTAQALLANMAGAYAVYHGPDGIRDIATQIHALARVAHREIGKAGFTVSGSPFFDTFTVVVPSSAAIQAGAESVGANVRVIDPTRVGVSLGEGTSASDIRELLSGAFGIDNPNMDVSDEMLNVPGFHREEPILTHPIFNQHHSETQMLRYLKGLENKDLALNHSMISLGSCTMKLNATSQMLPVTWP